MFMKFIRRQKGAMFGLDARIALSIFAGLSIIAGSAIVFTARDAQSKALLTDMSAIRDAVDNFQADTETSLHDAISTETNTNAFLALVDRSVLEAAARRHWLGPYLNKIRTNQHPDYGTMSISEAGGYYWLHMNGISPELFESVDSALDSPDLTSPETTGVVRYDSGTGELRWRLGVSF